MTSIRAAVGAACFLCVALLGATACSAVDLHLIVTGALVGAFRDLAPLYEQRSGDHLIIAFGPSAGTTSRAVPNRTRSEPFDAVITSKAGLEDLTKDGQVDGATRSDLARSGVGVAVRAGQPPVDVSSAAVLTKLLQGAASVGYSEGSSGVYVSTELPHRLDLDDAVKQRFRKITGRPVGEAVAGGDVEVGLQQISELRAVSGITYCGPLPASVQNYVTFAGAVGTGAANPAGARAFLAFLQSTDARPFLLNSGLEPVNAAQR